MESDEQQLGRLSFPPPTGQPVAAGPETVGAETVVSSAAGVRGSSPANEGGAARTGTRWPSSTVVGLGAIAVLVVILVLINR